MADTATNALDTLDQFRFDLTQDADNGQDARDAANEDMRFINTPGGMWEDFLTETFDENRVKMELDLVSPYVVRFVGEWNQNRVGVEYKPDDSKTTDDEAKLLNGIYRFDFRKSSGKISTDNAVNEVATCGVGAFKLATVFEDDSNPENDNMNVEWRPMFNAYSTMIWDASAKRNDKRDARRCVELAQFTKDSFEAQYPGKDPVSAYTPRNTNFQSTNTVANIFIATRYEIKRRKVEVFVYTNLRTSKTEVYSKEDHEKIKSTLADDEFRTFVRSRKIIEQSVWKTVFSGAEILEKERRIAGKWIPVIPFYGFRTYVDGVETYRGLVRKLKDPSRLFNMQVSQLAENASSGGQDIPIFTPEQMESPDIQAAWSDKNNKPYLVVDNVTDKEGNVISTGPIGYSKPAALDQSTTTLLAIIPEFIRNVTGGVPVDSFSKEMSGKLFKALVKRENLNTQVVRENIEDAIAWSGTVYQAIAAEVYSMRRKIRVIGKDGAETEVQLLEQVLDEKTGMAIEANNLKNSRFQAYADTGPQYETVQEQTVEDLKGMLEAIGQSEAGAQYLPVIMAVLMENITGVGLDVLKEFNRKVMLSQGLVKPETDEEKALVAQLQQPKEDPQAELVKAAATQQQAEALNLQASAENKRADTQKKVAETDKIRADMVQSQVEGLVQRAQFASAQPAAGRIN